MQREGHILVAQLHVATGPVVPPLAARLCVLVRTARNADGQHIGWQYVMPDLSLPQVEQAFRSIYEEIRRNDFLPIVAVETDSQPQFLSPQFHELCEDVGIEHRVIVLPELELLQ